MRYKHALFRPRNWRKSFREQTPHCRFCSMPMISCRRITYGVPRALNLPAGCSVLSSLVNKGSSVTHVGIHSYAFFKMSASAPSSNLLVFLSRCRLVRTTVSFEKAASHKGIRSPAERPVRDVGLLRRHGLCETLEVFDRHLCDVQLRTEVKACLFAPARQCGPGRAAPTAARPTSRLPRTSSRATGTGS